MNPVPGLPIVCLGCGCLCDDIPPPAASPGDGWPASVIDCRLGRVWMGQSRTGGNQPVAPPNRVGKQAATLDEALAAAAELLTSASAPLVCGWADQPLEAQRAAVALADHLGGVADWTSHPDQLSQLIAFQQQGASTATLGEVRRRADLVVYWGCDPRDSHPRHLQRFAGPKLRSGATRRVWAVDVGGGAGFADVHVALPAGDHLAALQTLRLLIAGDPVETPAELARLAEAMTSARYVAIFHGISLDYAGHAPLAALTALSQELHAHVRCVALPLGGAGNPHGAQNVLTWQTGYPAAVSFASGTPRYAPDEFNTTALLTCGRVDLALVAGDDLLAQTTVLAANFLRTAPYVALGHQETATMRSAQVAIAIAEPGVAAGGTVLRVDGVPLELRPLCDSPLPTAAEVLSKLVTCLVEGRT